MGARLVRQSLAFAADAKLDHAPTRLLVGMAVTAKDTDKPPQYWSGRDALARILGYPASDNGWRQAAAAIKKLLVAGALIKLTTARPGQSSRYAFSAKVTDQLNDYASDAPIDPGLVQLNDYASHVPIADGMGTSQATNGYVSSNEWVRLKQRMGTPETYPQEEIGIKEEEEETPPPPRSCTQHPTWDGATPCRACANDRRAHDAWNQAQPQRQPSTMRPTLIQLTPIQRALVDSALRGGSPVAPELQPALEEARREREAS